MKKAVFKKNLKRFIEEGREVITMPDMTQYNGYWINAHKEDAHLCCFGARVARAFCDPDDLDNVVGHYYRTGIAYLCRLFNIRFQNQLEALFYVCGASVKPFHGMEWPNTPEHVLEKLLLVERIPTPDEATDLYADYVDPSAKARMLYEKICLPVDHNGTAE